MSAITLEHRGLSTAAHAGSQATSPTAEPAPAAPAAFVPVPLPAAARSGVIPGGLRSAAERLSGVDLSAVRVHGSERPRDFGAHAFTEGSDITVAPGAERHLGHEVWHVVQQRSGRVAPTSSEAEIQRLEVEADRMADRLASCATTPGPAPARLGASGNLTPTRQFKLDPDNHVGKLLDDLGFDKRQQDVRDAVGKLHTAVRKSPVVIGYDDLVAAIKDVGANPKRIGKLLPTLEEQAKHSTDEGLSGRRGHMMTRHFGVGTELQERRLRVEGRERVTTVTSEGGHGHRYMNYVNRLARQLPGLMRTHIQDTALRVLRYLQDDDYLALNANGPRRQAIIAFIANLTTELEEDGYSVTFEWRVAVEGPAAAVRLTCVPEVQSDSDFAKTESRLDAESDSVVDSDSFDQLTMYWGSNAMVLEQLSPAMSDAELAEKINALDFKKLGVTHF